MFNLKSLKVVFVMAIVLIFVVSFVTTSACAQDESKGQKGRPHWEKGGKRGWRDEVPPGQEEADLPGWKEGEKKDGSAMFHLG